MLADPKSTALVDKLASAWLSADRVDLLNPNPEKYPSFDEELRQSLKQELSLFLTEFLTEDRSFKDTLDADFTYVDRRLADALRHSRCRDASRTTSRGSRSRMFPSAAAS